jgi:hypothetical protein
MSGQVVDTDSAREFMREARASISEEEMDAIARELEEKSRRFQSLLTQEKVWHLTGEELHRLLRSIFSTRRSTALIFQANEISQLQYILGTLLYGSNVIEERFQSFCNALHGVPETTRYDCASELLHYTFPERWWLWTRWMWDADNETGALRLVTMDEYDLHAVSLGETYLRVGEAVAFVNETAKAAGFQRLDSGLFGTNVYLALVYVVYMYTTLRMRMTQEFNKVVPQFPELARRILGVYRLEV